MADQQNQRLWNFPLLSSAGVIDNGGGNGNGESPPSRDPDSSLDQLANQLDHNELANLGDDDHHAKTEVSDVAEGVRQARQLPLAVEVRSQDPQNPKVGDIWLIAEQ